MGFCSPQCRRFCRWSNPTVRQPVIWFIVALSIVLYFVVCILVVRYVVNIDMNGNGLHCKFNSPWLDCMFTGLVCGLAVFILTTLLVGVTIVIFMCVWEARGRCRQSWLRAAETTSDSDQL